MADFINTRDVIGDDALTDSIIDRSVTEYKDDTVTAIGYCSLRACKSLTAVNCPAAKSIDTMAFNSCSNLTSADFSAVTSIGAHAFRMCTNLTSVNFPALTSIGGSAFHDCSKLTSVNFPALTSIGEFAFQGCANLTSLDFPEVTKIEMYGFNNCSKLTTVILRKNTVCSLDSTIGFSGTPIKYGTGYIYVPRNLVDSYKAAKNWSTYANQIRAIEDYPEICGG